MNILLIGGGGREHALAYAIAASPLLDRLYCAPGNPGTGQLGENVTLDIGDHDAVAQFCRANQIGLVVVEPEAPLVAGIVESLAARGIKAFGPSAAAAQLEGSKGFTKDLCAKAGIPTAAYHRFKDQEAVKHVSDRGAPLVVKLDGLAQGKGSRSPRRCRRPSRRCGRPQQRERLRDRDRGPARRPRAPPFALCDGRHVLPLSTAEDYKRVGDGDTGPNTGGMGGILAEPARRPGPRGAGAGRDHPADPRRARRHGHPLSRVLYAGLMLTPEGPKLIEYNVRFGDPECQVLMLRLKDDIVTLVLAAVDGVLDTMSARFHDEAALTVANAGAYPGKVEADSADCVARSRRRARPGGSRLPCRNPARWREPRSASGRVLNVTATGPTLEAAFGNEAFLPQGGVADRFSRRFYRSRHWCATAIKWSYERTLEKLEPRMVAGAGGDIFVRVGGDGPPLLLLHGYPQTHVMWHRLAPVLARHFRLVIADPRGYGRSSMPQNDRDNRVYSKRAMAADLVAVMTALGHERFAVAGHDRGGRVGYRMALDAPAVVERLAVLDIIPTYDMWTGMDGKLALKVYHWPFLAQAPPMPERLIESDTRFYLDWTLASWTKSGDLACFDEAALAAYRTALLHRAAFMPPATTIAPGRPSISPPTVRTNPPAAGSPARRWCYGAPAAFPPKLPTPGDLAELVRHGRRPRHRLRSFPGGGEPVRDGGGAHSLLLGSRMSAARIDRQAAFSGTAEVRTPTASMPQRLLPTLPITSTASPDR